ncbi:MAG: HIT domain-containing protein [Bacteroidales bacterium]|nr:HIT domain-containing protein [Bacteroidales bacterium]
MANIFLKIIDGTIPCYKIAENDDYLAFLDINPLAEGHTLVIPKNETDYIFDMNDESFKGLFLFAKKVALAIKKVVPCKKIGISVLGLEVPHAHIHLVPINSVYDIDFKREKIKFTPEEFQKIASEISALV